MRNRYAERAHDGDRYGLRDRPHGSALFFAIEGKKSNFAHRSFDRAPRGRPSVLRYRRDLCETGAGRGRQTDFDHVAPRGSEETATVEAPTVL